MLKNNYRCMCVTPRATTVLHPPQEIAEMRANPEAGIAIDDCLAELIRELWSQGYITLGCCCGHGDESPSIVLGQYESDERIEEIERLIGDTDGRYIKLLQWRLTEVNKKL